MLCIKLHSCDDRSACETSCPAMRDPCQAHDRLLAHDCWSAHDRIVVCLEGFIELMSDGQLMIVL